MIWKYKKSTFTFLNHRKEYVFFFFKPTILKAKLWFCQIFNCVFKNYIFKSDNLKYVKLESSLWPFKCDVSFTIVIEFEMVIIKF